MEDTIRYDEYVLVLKHHTMEKCTYCTKPEPWKEDVQITSLHVCFHSSTFPCSHLAAQFIQMSAVTTFASDKCFRLADICCSGPGRNTTISRDGETSDTIHLTKDGTKWWRTSLAQIHEEQTLPFINHFQIFPFKETAHFWFPGQNCSN